MSEQSKDFFAEPEIQYGAYSPVKSSHLRRWQFSLKTMIISVTIFAVLLALAQLPPLLAIVVVILHFAILAALLIAVIYGRGWIRPFAICAILPFVAAIFILPSAVNFTFQLCVAWLVFVAFSVIVGISGAIMHGYLSRRSWLVPIPNVPILRNWLSN